MSTVLESAQLESAQLESVLHSDDVQPAPTDATAREVAGLGAVPSPTDPPAPQEPGFSDLGLPDRLLGAVDKLGFRVPTAIQAKAIPALLDGRDITGIAQTGTGKTAAFGLPLLATLDPRSPRVQALVLTPTRELANQVAEAIESFARPLTGVAVVAVYGGAPFLPQRAALRAGAQVVVGTPGRIIDHLDRGTLDISALRTLVLDEADEMLRMGFAEDVDRILESAPPSRQTALFSATMPPAIRSVAAKHLTDPVDISVSRQSSTVTSVRQTYAVVPFRDKVDAVTRVLQVREGDAAIVFVRTKEACDQVGAELMARGLSAAAINGDVAQKERERIIDRLRSGKLDILVATDVAARGLDVERIDLVVNFDAPGEPEAYVHRIGRTGRAGRTGEALTFFTPREVGRLRAIEKATRTALTQVTPPSEADVAAHQVTRVLAQATARSRNGGLGAFRDAVKRHVAEHDVDAGELAAVLLAMAAGDDGGTADELPTPAAPAARFDERVERGGNHPERPRRAGMSPAGPRYRVEVGRQHGVRPAGIVGAITAEGGLAGKDLGRIDIFDTYSLVEISAEMSRDAFRRISRAVVSGRPLDIRLDRTTGREQRGPAVGRTDTTRPRRTGLSAGRAGHRKSGY